MNRLLFAIGICALFIVISSSVLLSVKGSSSVNIFPPESKPYGLTYAEHAQNFWKWLLSTRPDNSPMSDPTGEKCAVGQINANSSVFYLSPTEGKSERSCIVPTGKGLLIPVMQVEISDKESPGATVEDLHNAAKKDQDSVNSMNLRINDKEYNFDDLDKYRVHTDVFEVVWPDNGLFGVVKGGPSKAVADGRYILTEPLAPGNYTIHFKSSLSCLEPGCAEPSFAQDVKYNIIAK
jgi:hypothetical protein